MNKVYESKKELIKNTIRGKVLDIGFWGQAVSMNATDWPHKIIKSVAKETWGVDLDYDGSLGNKNYFKASAENFNLPVKNYFDFIFAGDIIEHLSNPGLFLKKCSQHINPSGKLIITTPNSFNLFSIAEKLVKNEPSINPDHTMYFNHTTIKKLLEKNGWKVTEAHYIRTPKKNLTMSLSRYFIYFLDRIFNIFTPKLSESIVVIAQKT